MPVSGSGDPRFYHLLDQMAQMHASKSHDYASESDVLSNFKRSAALGVEPWRGALVRMSDKWSRIEQLSVKDQPKNESLRDSLLDLASYALLVILLREE